jgi:hypothetical protein
MRKKKMLFKKAIKITKKHERKRRKKVGTVLTMSE